MINASESLKRVWLGELPMCYNFEDKLDFGTVAGHIFEAFKSGVFY